MKKIILVLTILFFLNNYSFYGQNINLKKSKRLNLREFIWDEELCRYKGKYDSTIITYKQLKNSYDIVFNTWRFDINSKSKVLENIEEISKLNLDTLKCECDKKIKELGNLDVIETKYWQNLKLNKISELKQVCEYSKLAIIAYSNPENLLNFTSSEECKKYIYGLIKGGDELIKVWSELIAERNKENFNEYEYNEFQNQLKSNNKYIYAQICVITFGWWNCINQTIQYVDQGSFHNEFRKNFIEIKEECEEP
jgi:hypothetical protein